MNNFRQRMLDPFGNDQTSDATEEKTHKKQHWSKDVQFSSPKT